MLVHADAPTWNGEGDPPCTYLAQYVNSINVCYVRLRGPVRLSQGTMPVRVERRLFGGSTVDVTDLFEAVILPDHESGSTNARNNLIEVRPKLVVLPNGTSYQPDFGFDVEYWISEDPFLRSVDAGGAETPADFELHFVIHFDCRYDLVAEYDQNGDGVLDGYDLVEWTYEPGDLNDDGQTNGADIWVLVQVIEEYEGQP